MRIESMVTRDDIRKVTGEATVSLNSAEITLLNNLLYQATKDESYHGPLLKLYKDMKLLNAAVQYGAIDSFDIGCLYDINKRLFRKEVRSSDP